MSNFWAFHTTKPLWHALSVYGQIDIHCTSNYSQGDGLSPVCFQVLFKSIYTAASQVLLHCLHNSLNKFLHHMDSRWHSEFLVQHRPVLLRCVKLYTNQYITLRKKPHPQSSKVLICLLSPSIPYSAAINQNIPFHSSTMKCGNTQNTSC